MITSYLIRHNNPQPHATLSSRRLYNWKHHNWKHRTTKQYPSYSSFNVDKVVVVVVFVFKYPHQKLVSPNIKFHQNDMTEPAQPLDVNTPNYDHGVRRLYSSLFLLIRKSSPTRTQ